MYIFRIERLWRDVEGALDPANSHLICAQYVFLPGIQADLDTFTDSWNNHALWTEHNCFSIMKARFTRNKPWWQQNYVLTTSLANIRVGNAKKWYVLISVIKASDDFNQNSQKYFVNPRQWSIHVLLLQMQKSIALDRNWTVFSPVTSQSMSDISDFEKNKIQEF